MTIQVKIRHVWGNKRIYPICDKAKIFACLANQSTLTHTEGVMNLIDKIKNSDKVASVLFIQRNNPTSVTWRFAPGWCRSGKWSTLHLVSMGILREAWTEIENAQRCFCYLCIKECKDLRYLIEKAIHDSQS